MASRLTEETMRQRWSCRPEEEGGPGPGGLGKPQAWQANAAAVAGPGPRLCQCRQPTSRLREEDSSRFPDLLLSPSASREKTTLPRSPLFLATFSPSLSPSAYLPDEQVTQWHCL